MQPRINWATHTREKETKTEKTVFFQGWDSQNFLRQILKIFATSKWIWEPMTQIR
jgi:hypothetical protein